MKASHYFIIFILLELSATSQTIIRPDPLSKMHYSGGDSISFDNSGLWSKRDYDHFVIGWQWVGPNKETNRRLKCNVYQGPFGSDSIFAYRGQLPYDTDTCNLIWGNIRTVGNTEIWDVSQQGLQFDPTADTSLMLNPKSRPHDTTGAVLGFKTRHASGHLFTFPDDNFDRFVVDTSVGGSGASGVVVLSDPVLQDKYSYKPKTHNGESESGRYWVFTINLRRISNLDTLDNNDTLLSFQLPYKRKTGVPGGLLVFDSIPASSAIGHAYYLPRSRGLVMPMSSAPSNTQVFYILRKMLPHGNATGLARDITLSAIVRFKTDGDLLCQNPNLTGYGLADSAVKSVGITIEYHGKGAVGIDWCRFATPSCDSLLKGLSDSLIWIHTNFTLHKIQKWISDSGASRMRLMAFYGLDETPIEFMLSHRYYRYLFDGRFTVEGAADNLSLAIADLRMPWLGGLAEIYHPFAPTTGIHNGQAFALGSYTFSMKSGWHDGADSFHPVSYDGSSYETSIWNGAFLSIKRSDCRRR